MKAIPCFSIKYKSLRRKIGFYAGGESSRLTVPKKKS